MAEIVNIGENFYKDGKEVTVVKLGKMVINNKEYECVVYDYVDRKCRSTVVGRSRILSHQQFLQLSETEIEL